MSKKHTLEEFIKKATKIHGDKYDYSLVEYKNSDTKVKIVCPKHGEFLITPEHILQGKGCWHCGREASAQKQRMTKEEFVKKAKEVHGDKYDYSLVEYKNNRTKIKVICPKHGEFLTTPGGHISGRIGCSKCYKESRILGKEYFVEKARKIHGDSYDYSKFDFVTSKIKSYIICKKCGKEFSQTMQTHVTSKAGCPHCKRSKGEKKIELFLKDNGFDYIQNKKFDDLRDKYQLSYDFYIPDKKLLIEYNGVQHYNYNPALHNDDCHNFLIQKHHDWLKRDYARKSSLNFLVIPYWEYDNIQDILGERLGAKDV